MCEAWNQRGYWFIRRGSGGGNPPASEAPAKLSLMGGLTNPSFFSYNSSNRITFKTRPERREREMAESSARHEKPQPDGGAFFVWISYLSHPVTPTLTPWSGTTRPSMHRCNSLLVCLVFPILGFSSHTVNSTWPGIVGLSIRLSG